MYQGKTLQELAIELDRQNAVKEDLIANTSRLRLYDDGNNLEVDGLASYPMLPLAEQQIGARVGIPAKYFNRMRDEAPELLATNVNHWFESKPENRMLRLLDGNVRAFLSDRYQRRDNYELMKFVLPTLKDIDGLSMASCEVTEHKLYLKVTTKRVQAEVQKGDVVQAGLVISNSEVGLGAFKVQPLVLRLVCMNGMISNTYGMSKYHVGKRITAEEQVQVLFSDETLRADDEAFFLKARDIVKGALSEETFMMIVEQLMEASENPIKVKPAEAVERLQKRYQLTQDEGDNVLENLLKDNNITQYGLSNAVTRASKDVNSYDRATELEELGGNIITLSPSEWKEVAA